MPFGSLMNCFKKTATDLAEDYGVPKQLVEGDEKDTSILLKSESLTYLDIPLVFQEVCTDNSWVNAVDYNFLTALAIQTPCKLFCEHDLRCFGDAVSVVSTVEFPAKKYRVKI